ncbi:hypothetical protein B0H14DRAFT_2592221 [Mycena olivaceomarginata]|nr:hypothetical protein B0H14DRAFT_2592221 [Mycena olivaceomarginata]
MSVSGLDNRVSAMEARLANPEHPTLSRDLAARRGGRFSQAKSHSTRRSTRSIPLDPALSTDDSIDGDDTDLVPYTEDDSASESVQLNEINLSKTERRLLKRAPKSDHERNLPHPRLRAKGGRSAKQGNFSQGCDVGGRRTKGQTWPPGLERKDTAEQPTWDPAYLFEVAKDVQGRDKNNAQGGKRKRAKKAKANYRLDEDGGPPITEGAGLLLSKLLAVFGRAHRQDLEGVLAGMIDGSLSTTSHDMASVVESIKRQTNEIQVRELHLMLSLIQLVLNVDSLRADNKLKCLPRRRVTDKTLAEQYVPGTHENTFRDWVHHGKKLLLLDSLPPTWSQVTRAESTVEIVQYGLSRDSNPGYKYQVRFLSVIDTISKQTSSSLQSRAFWRTWYPQQFVAGSTIRPLCRRRGKEGTHRYIIISPPRADGVDDAGALFGLGLAVQQVLVRPIVRPGKMKYGRNGRLRCGYGFIPHVPFLADSITAVKRMVSCPIFGACHLRNESIVSVHAYSDLWKEGRRKGREGEKGKKGKSGGRTYLELLVEENARLLVRALDDAQRRTAGWRERQSMGC